MSLMQITEPNKKSKHVDDQTAIGIDFGTTNCVCTFFKNGVYNIITDEYKKKLIPSVVAFSGDNFFIGNQVFLNKDIPKENYIFSIKRHLIRNQSKKIIKISNDIILSPLEISSIIFEYIKKLIKEDLKETTNKCVITVPAYFDELSRVAVKKAAINSGFDVLRLINEPTAAALAYGLEKKVKGNYFVYDLGGGTFDISLLKLSDGIFRVLRTGGNVNLGGDDIDLAIAKNICKKLLSTKYEKLTSKQKVELIMLSKKSKENYNKNHSSNVKIDFFKNINEIEVSSELIEESANDIIDTTIRISKSVLNESELTLSKIDGFILVGGSTKLDYLKNRLKESFEVKFFSDINPEIIVAQGAASHAHALLNGSDNLLLDVTPLSLGIETAGGLMEKIIERNSTIPITKEQEFTTFENGQTAIKINILQGEREICKYNRSLGEFVLSGIEPKPAGIPRIKVRFSVDSDGILDVSAYDENSGEKHIIEVQPVKQLNNDEVIEMIKDSVNNSKMDLEERSVLEAVIEGQRCLNELNYLNDEIITLCSKEEQKKIFVAIDDLKLKIKEKKKYEIKKLIDKLNLLTQNFAQKRIENSIGSGLVGQDLDNL